jgi:hypothetical protein
MALSKPKGTRYYSDDDVEWGVTPSQLKRLGREKQLEYMRFWFEDHYADPVHEMPYNSREGGYQFIHGGPYDAGDELSGEFGSIVAEERIQELADELVSETGVSDWAPTSNHPSRKDEGYEDHDLEVYEPDLDVLVGQLERGARVSFGGPLDLQLRQQILDALSELERRLAPVKPVHGGIGHNQPPNDDDGLIDERIQEVIDASRDIRPELNEKKPNALTVGRSAQRLKRVLDWVKSKADRSVNSFATAVGAIAAAGAAQYLPGVWQGVDRVVSAVTQWLETVTSAF